MLLQLAFSFTALLTVVLFGRSCGFHRLTMIVVLGWMALQGAVAATGFYTVTDVVPPRFILMIAPVILAMVILFTTQNGKQWIDQMDLRWLTLLHIVRIPVEVCLHQLYVEGWIPEVMTYEGRNWDIVSGISAPIIFVLAFRNNQTNRMLLLVWNIICLVLLVNIVVHAVLAAPSPFQQLAFDQPNKAVLYFPFNWLPCAIVPMVLFAHLAAFRQLFKAPRFLADR